MLVARGLTFMIFSAYFWLNHRMRLRAITVFGSIRPDRLNPRSSETSQRLCALHLRALHLQEMRTAAFLGGLGRVCVETESVKHFR
jgi:hypothetical protein